MWEFSIWQPGIFFLLGGHPECIVVFVGVLEEAIHRVGDFVGEQEVSLSGDPAVVEPFLSAEDELDNHYPQPVGRSSSNETRQH